MAQNIALLIFLIILSGFFSGAEVALLSISHIKVRTYLKDKRQGSVALSRLKSQPRRIIITILIGNNVANITAAAIATVIATKKFGSTGIGVVTGVLTFLILVFGEITPKTFASKYAGRISLLIAKPIEIFKYSLYPLVVFFDWLTQAMEKLVKLKKLEPITESEIKTMIQYGVEKKVVAPEEQLIINRALAFSDTTAKDVMVPLKNVFSLPADELLATALKKMIKSGFSRIPVYDKSASDIIGIVLVKEIIKELATQRKGKVLKDVVGQPIIVPESMRIDYLFKIFQKKHRHFAIVQSSGNKAVGIATLEDLIEELVGEIVDESDVEVVKVNNSA